MLERVRRWYNGTPKVRVHENDPNSMFVFMPTPYDERHWTAEVAHAIVDFCRRHFALIALVVSLLGLFATLASIWLAL